MTRHRFLAFPLLLLLTAAPAAAQLSGTIEGTVRDAQGLVMPGVTVTLYGPAVLGEQTTVTLEDGTYRFRGLRPGTYNLRFELSGFQTLNREGIIVEGGKTITVNVVLQVATVAETITVTGESPVVDVKNTALSNEFDVTALHEVPSATDVWAVLAQSPGVRMRGYDVGGSHKSQQTAYESFGIRSQNRVLSDGVDSTEGTGGTGFYYDYYAVEEFTTAAAGADVEMTTPGSMIVMTIKSGGNELSGLYHIDWEDDSFVANNIDAELEARGGTPAPVRLFWEGHADLGGPIVRDRAWFFGAYNHFKIDKQISGVDPSIATDIGIFDNYTGKLTYQLTQKDQFIGYSQWGRKQKPFRGLSLTTPPESILAQDSWSWVHKAEWQRVWSDRAFSNVQVKHFGFTWPMTPAVDPETHPSRIDIATGVNSGAGFLGLGTPPFTFRRWKPQVTATMNYYLPARAGSHDFKLGFDFQEDSSQINANANSGTIRYLDNSALGRPHNVDEIRFVNVPNTGNDNRDRHVDLFAQDTWTPNERVTLNLGVRFSRQRAFYPDATLEPIRTEFFPTGRIEGQTLVVWNSWAPRLGVTVDLTGEGKTVLKGHYGRYYVNIADSLSNANPAGIQFVQFKFLDPNQNGLYDGPEELGEIVADTRGGGGGVPVNPDLDQAYADEISISVEHELVTDTAVRFSYVRKQMRNMFYEADAWNRAQVLPLLEGRGIPCGDAIFPCPLDPFTGQPLSLVRVPDEVANAQDPIQDTWPAPFDEANYDTIQLAFNRRFTESFFVQGSFDYQWRDEPRSAAGESSSPLVADPIAIEFFQNHNTRVSNRQETTNWQGKLLGRYVFPGELAVSANVRVQSGWPWAPIHRVNIPGSGTMPFFLDDLKNRRSENVTLVDLRVEKGFRFERFRLSAMADLYNVLNNNAETNFVLRTGASFRNIIEWTAGRTLKLGLRLTF